MGDRDGAEKQTAAMILTAARIVPEQQEPQMILTAQQTGSLPVYALGGGGYRYRFGDDGEGVEFDVRALAAMMPRFEAGETMREHGSLILLAAAHPKGLSWALSCAAIAAAWWWKE